MQVGLKRSDAPTHGEAEASATPATTDGQQRPERCTQSSEEQLGSLALCNYNNLCYMNATVLERWWNLVQVSSRLAGRDSLGVWGWDAFMHEIREHMQITNGFPIKYLKHLWFQWHLLGIQQDDTKSRNNEEVDWGALTRRPQGSESGLDDY